MVNIFKALKLSSRSGSSRSRPTSAETDTDMASYQSDRTTFPSYLQPSFLQTIRSTKRSTTSATLSSDATSPLSPLSPGVDTIFDQNETASSSANTTPASSLPQPSFLDTSLPLQATQHLNKPYTTTTTAQETLHCASCSTDIAFASQIISKGFTGRHGRAYLLSPLPSSHTTSNSSTTSSYPYTTTRVPTNGAEALSACGLLNIFTHPAQSRHLVTGLHLVADISCKICERVLGWKYVDASEPSQRYKIGKFIVETKRVVACNHFEDVPEQLLDYEVDDEMRRARREMEGEGEWKGKGKGKAERVEDDIEFDSEDEDECEEIFNGTWDKEVVRRRQKKGWKKVGEKEKAAGQS